MCGSLSKRMLSPVAACFFLFSFLFSSCGLETLYYLEPPTNVVEVNFGNDNRVLDELSFVTGDNSSIGSDFNFQGTAVYYRIFDTEQAARDSYNYISGNNSSSDISAAANSIINAKKYSPLISEISNNNTLVEYNSAYVKIRLNRIGDLREYASGIYVNNTFISYPRRHYQAGARKLGFEFSKIKDKIKNPIPQQNDSDVSMSSATNSEGKWYVDLWAFSQGIDNNYSYSYSRAVHLGCIKIEESYYDD